MADPLPISPNAETQALLGRLYAFCFPGGEAPAREVRSIRTKQEGEMRMSPEARWIPFVAEEFTSTRESNFRWEARLDPGKLVSPTVTDEYNEGHGRLVVKFAGVVPVRTVSGPDADRGELQRNLSSIIFCPPILLNHTSLDCAAVGRQTLRFIDKKDSTGATVEVEISETGQPLACRANRPRIVGKQAILTPWSGSCSEFREWEGLRIPTRLEVWWHYPEGPFTYYRSKIISLSVER